MPRKGKGSKKPKGRGRNARHETVARFWHSRIKAAIEASGADLVLVSNTPNGWDVAPRVAASLD